MECNGGNWFSSNCKMETLGPSQELTAGRVPCLLDILLFLFLCSWQHCQPGPNQLLLPGKRFLSCDGEVSFGPSWDPSEQQWPLFAQSTGGWWQVLEVSGSCSASGVVQCSTELQDPRGKGNKGTSAMCLAIRVLGRVIPLRGILRTPQVSVSASAQQSSAQQWAPLGCCFCPVHCGHFSFICGHS